MAKFSTFGDGFNDNSINATLWNSFSSSATVAETNQQLEVTPASSVSGSNYAGLTSVSTYDLYGSFAMVEVPVVTSSTPFASTHFKVRLDADNELSFSKQGLYLYLYVKVDGNISPLRYTYSTEQRFWRFRESGLGTTIVNFEVSSDGESWTNLWEVTVASSFTMGSLTAEIAAGTNSSTSSPGTAAFDNFNFQSAEFTADSSASDGGTLELTSESATIEAGSSASGGGNATLSTKYQALPQKDYEARVFTKDGTFMTVYKDIIIDFNYTQAINSNASELTIGLARSPESRSITLSALKDSDGNNILDDNSDTILVQTSTSNTVGTGTDVDYGLNVDIYAFYGGYDALQDSDGENILDSDGDVILVQFGAPNGKRVYSGYIVDYELLYGEESGVEVIIVPHATRAQHHVYKDGSGNTTVTHNSEDPVAMARSAIDHYVNAGGEVSYTSETMPLSGQVSSYPFKLQTDREVVDKSIELLPEGYYHYPHPGENLWYLLSKSETANHTFYYEKHLTELRLRKSGTQLVNKVYFVGGDTGSGDLFKYYEDTTSQTDYGPGLLRLSDTRVTLATSAQALSQRQINEFKEPRWRSSVIITDAVYDIESIKLGQMIAFKNFGSLVDDLLLQAVSITRSKHTITIELDMFVGGEAKRLQEIKRNILSEEVKGIGAAPS